MTFIRESISIKEHNVNKLIKIHKSETDETYSLFFQLEATNFLSVFLLIIANTTILNSLLIVMFYI